MENKYDYGKFEESKGTYNGQEINIDKCPYCDNDSFYIDYFEKITETITYKFNGEIETIGEPDYSRPWKKSTIAKCDNCEKSLGRWIK